MPITVNQRKNGGYAILRATSTEFINTSSIAAAGETVGSFSISEVSWSVDSSNRWTVTRGNGVGANTVAILNGSGHLDFQATGMRIESTDLLTANATFTLSGGNGFIVAKLHKVSGE